MFSSLNPLLYLDSHLINPVYTEFSKSRAIKNPFICFKL